MAQQWYVVHTYSGYENRAKQNLEERVKNLVKGEFFSEILVPTETVVELVKGKKKTSQRKIFPGYLLVKMELNEETWHIVRELPRSPFAGDGRSPFHLGDRSGRDSVPDEGRSDEGEVKVSSRLAIVFESLMVPLSTSSYDRGGQTRKRS
jgi:transcription antitermination factor NusG